MIPKWIRMMAIILVISGDQTLASPMKTALPPGAVQELGNIAADNQQKVVAEDDEDVDIEKLFESYDKMFTNDNDLQRPLVDEEAETKDIISNVKEIVAQAKTASARNLSNATDDTPEEKTVVVVVTTNVIRPDDKVIKQQHNELSFGHPLLVTQKKPIESDPIASEVSKPIAPVEEVVPENNVVDKNKVSKPQENIVADKDEVSKPVSLIEKVTQEINVTDEKQAISSSHDNNTENEIIVKNNIVVEGVHDNVTEKESSEIKKSSSDLPKPSSEDQNIFTPSTQYQQELTTPSALNPIEEYYFTTRHPPPSTTRKRGILQNMANFVADTLENFMREGRELSDESTGRSYSNNDNIPVNVDESLTAFEKELENDIFNNQPLSIATMMQQASAEDVAEKQEVEDSIDSVILETLEDIVDPEVREEFTKDVLENHPEIETNEELSRKENLSDLEGYVIEEMPPTDDIRYYEVDHKVVELGVEGSGDDMKKSIEDNQKFVNEAENLNADEMKKTTGVLVVEVESSEIKDPVDIVEESQRSMPIAVEVVQPDNRLEELKDFALEIEHEIKEAAKDNSTEDETKSADDLEKDVREILELEDNQTNLLSKVESSKETRKLNANLESDKNNLEQEHLESINGDPAKSVNDDKLIADIGTNNEDIKNPKAESQQIVKMVENEEKLEDKKSLDESEKQNNVVVDEIMDVKNIIEDIELENIEIRIMTGPEEPAIPQFVKPVQETKVQYEDTSKVENPNTVVLTEKSIPINPAITFPCQLPATDNVHKQEHEISINILEETLTTVEVKKKMTTPTPHHNDAPTRIYFPDQISTEKKLEIEATRILGTSYEIRKNAVNLDSIIGHPFPSKVTQEFDLSDINGPIRSNEHGRQLNLQQHETITDIENEAKILDVSVESLQHMEDASFSTTSTVVPIKERIPDAPLFTDSVISTKLDSDAKLPAFPTVHSVALEKDSSIQISEAITPIKTQPLESIPTLQHIVVNTMVLPTNQPPFETKVISDDEEVSEDLLRTIVETAEVTAEINRVIGSFRADMEQNDGIIESRSTFATIENSDEMDAGGMGSALAHRIEEDNQQMTAKINQEISTIQNDIVMISCGSAATLLLVAVTVSVYYYCRKTKRIVFYAANAQV